MREDNSIFIGNKPFMNYVTGVIMQFTTKGAKVVKVKARGKFISRAVDVSEVSAKRFLDETIFVHDIKIDSEEFQNQEGRNVRVSTIEIVLVKKDGLEPHLSQPIRMMGTRSPRTEERKPRPVSEPVATDQPSVEPAQEPTNSW